MIERRLARAGVGRSHDDSVGGAAVPRPLVARMLAGALMETIRWWQDHPSAATPAEMDAAFHTVARGVLGAYRGERATTRAPAAGEC